MSSTTKIYEEKMTNCVNHLTRELATIRAGRANPAILDKVAVDYYGAPTPINQIAAVAVAEARILTITPGTARWSTEHLQGDPDQATLASTIDDGHTIAWCSPHPPKSAASS